MDLSDVMLRLVSRVVKVDKDMVMSFGVSRSAVHLEVRWDGVVISKSVDMVLVACAGGDAVTEMMDAAFREMTLIKRMRGAGKNLVAGGLGR